MLECRFEQVVIVGVEDELTAGIIEASVRDAGHPVLIDQCKVRVATA